MMEKDTSEALSATPGLGAGDDRLRLALEEVGLAIWETDFERRQSVWSANHFRLFGYPIDPTGRATLEMWSARLHPDDHQRVIAELNRAKARREVYRSEYRIVRADTDETLWLESRGRFLFGPDGKPKHLVGVCLETTARKLAEEELIRREAQLDLATRLVGIGVFDHDHIGNRLYWSDQFRKIHDVPPTMEPGLRALEEQIHPADRERLYAAVSAAHDPAGDGSFTIEYRIKRRDGDVRWIVGHARTTFAGEGADRRAVRTVGAELDVTERRRAEARLRNSEEALRKADQRKDEFLATLAHELRNPLAPIRTAAEMLTLPNLAPHQLAWSRQVIHRQVEHMARLLDDLLDVARITRGKLQLRLQPVDLATIVDTAVEAARPLLAAKDHTLTIALPNDLPSFDADPVRLAQILSNLLTNAAKYTDSPGGKIAVTARVEDGMLRVSVRDNGIGLSPVALADIFTMFSQVQNSHSRAEGGLGIGLALVKGLVDLHGGSIEVFSEGPGFGSEFVVILPCQACQSAQPHESASSTAGIAAIGRKILVADDNLDAANTLSLLLRLAGHDVRTAHGGQPALKLAAEFHPEFAFLDIGMPDLDGYEVAKRLRLTDDGKNLRLIALTGLGQDEDKRRAFDAGFDYHLTKPVDLKRLDALLARQGEGSHGASSP